MLNRYKKGMTLMELVITIAVTAIVLAEIGTFLVFFQKQTNYINNQEEVFLAITTIKEEVNYEFNFFYSNGYTINVTSDEKNNIVIKDENNVNIIKTGDDIWDETVANNGYDKRIDKIVYRNESGYIKCTVSYILTNSTVEQTYTFIIIDHIGG